MEEVIKVALENMGKMASYNKAKYGQKARAVEVSVGDRMLMQNKRDRDGDTGKFTSYWEHNIFNIIEEKEDLPVMFTRNKSCSTLFLDVL